MESELLHPIELLETPPRVYDRGDVYEDTALRCTMTMSCTWPSENPLDLVISTRTSTAEYHVRQAYPNRCVRPEHDRPCSVTIDFGAAQRLAYVDLVTSAQCLEIFVGYRTPNGGLRFVYAENAFGLPDRDAPGLFRVEHACSETQTFNAIAAISFKFVEIGDDDTFILDHLHLVFLQSIPSKTSAPRELRPQPWRPHQVGYPPYRQNGSHRDPFHSHHPATPGPMRQPVARHPTAHQFEGFMSSRSLPESSHPSPSIAEKSTSDKSSNSIESMSAMMMVLDMQKKMLEDLEKRICATIDLKVHKFIQRIETSEQIIGDLETRLEGIQQDKEIIFSGINHRLDKLEGNFEALKKEQNETAESVQTALQKATAVRPSNWQY